MPAAQKGIGPTTPLGANLVTGGCTFRVWAPRAEAVCVTGPFNGWAIKDEATQLVKDGRGIWAGFVPFVTHGTPYKYHVVSRYHGYRVDKADPFAVHQETPPKTGSKVWSLEGFGWSDDDWMRERRQREQNGGPERQDGRANG